MNGFKQVFVMHGLGEEIQSAALHRLNAHGNVAVAAKENDRNHAAFRSQSCLQLQTIQAGHRNVEHETAWFARIVLLEKFMGRTESSNLQPSRAQHARQTLEHGWIVVHYKDFWGAIMHGCSAGCAGIVK